MTNPRLWLTVLFLVGLLLPAVAQSDSLSDILSDLQGVEDEMVANQMRIDDLKDNITQLQLLGKSAEAEIISLQVLVKAHAARVEQLGDRYTKVLTLAQKLKKDLEFSSTLNYALGAGVIVATVVAIVEGWALMKR